MSILLLIPVYRGYDRVKMRKQSQAGLERVGIIQDDIEQRDEVLDACNGEPKLRPCYVLAESVLWMYLR